MRHKNGSTVACNIIESNLWSWIRIWIWFESQSSVPRSLDPRSQRRHKHYIDCHCPTLAAHFTHSSPPHPIQSIRSFIHSFIHLPSQSLTHSLTPSVTRVVCQSGAWGSHTFAPKKMFLIFKWSCQVIRKEKEKWRNNIIYHFKLWLIWWIQNINLKKMVLYNIVLGYKYNRTVRCFLQVHCCRNSPEGERLFEWSGSRLVPANGSPIRSPSSLSCHLKHSFLSSRTEDLMTCIWMGLCRLLRNCGNVFDLYLWRRGRCYFQK